jgi:hypothetical protein
MLRFPLTTFGLIAFATLASAQSVNVYNNPYWIQDSIVGLTAPDPVGLNLRPRRLDLKRHADFLQFDQADSNAYSRLNFGSASNQNQHLFAAVHRPLAKYNALDFDLYRISNPGWMTNSQARLTDASAALKLSTKDQRLQAEVNGGVSIQDREQNGGLTSDTLTISQNGGGLGALNGAVYLDSPYQRRSQITLDALGKAKLLDALNASFKTAYYRDRFVYSDPAPDVAYYEHLRLDTSLMLGKDSSALGNWSNRLNLEFNRDQSPIKATIGIRHDLHNYVSNERTFQATNTSLLSSLTFDATSWTGALHATTVIDGYNAGDGMMTFHLQRSVSIDSSHTSEARSLLYARLQRYRPALVYHDYRSVFTPYQNSLEQVLAFDAQLNHSMNYDRIEWKVTMEYQWRLNQVYMTDTFSVAQSSSPIALLSIASVLKYKRPRFNALIDVRYQQQVAAPWYDLPKWLGHSDVSYKFPLFKKSIYMNGGLKAQFFDSYKARGYYPSLGLFYVQSNQRFGPYLQIDPYVKVNIQSVDVSLALVNAAYGLIRDNPFIAPGYAMVPRYIAMSIDWKFKN